MSAAELKDFIKQSSLSDDNKQFWDSAFSFMNDDEAGIAARFVNGDERTLMFYTDTMRRKYEAFKNNNRTLLDEVLDQERAELLSI